MLENQKKFRYNINMKKEDKSEMLDFIMEVYKKDKYFFHYLVGWMSGSHLEDMVEAARIYQNSHTKALNDKTSE